MGSWDILCCMTAKKVSAPTPPEKKRPSFSAPTPPKSDPTKVLENNREEEEIAVLRDDVEGVVVGEAEPKKKVVAVVKQNEDNLPAEEGKRRLSDGKEADDLGAVLDDIEADVADDASAEDAGVSVVNLVVFVLLLLFGLIGWFLYLREAGVFGASTQTIVGEAVPTPTMAGNETVEQAPTPTVAQLPRSEITLEVLNGSGVSGAAGRAAATLEELGYPEIKVGNTEATDGNELYLNPGYQGQVEVLLSDLEKELDIATVAGELTGSDLVGRVILGK